MNIESETQHIQEHIDKGNYHAAMNLAISAMNECRREQDQDGVDHFIAVIRSIANTIAKKLGSS